MSDRIIPMYTLACDWPGCEETAADDEYAGMESYESALDRWEWQEDHGDWLHIGDNLDFCPKHWHWDDEHGRVPGPEPKEEA